MDLSLTLGKKIRARRLELGLTAEELAIKTGINRTYISKIEKHGYLPSPKVLTNIVKHLNDNSVSYLNTYEYLKYPGMSEIRRFSPRQDQRLLKALNIKDDLTETLRTTTDSATATKYKQVLSNYDKLIDSFFKAALKNLSTIEPQTAKRYEKHLKEQK